ncbi:MAG TPA: ABC transporter substrate-binding protein [Hyphomicrobiales bacterium]|nr:ABC transporter substrate-binding protein [Hyphomicrobiales bacterium]
MKYWMKSRGLLPARPACVALAACLTLPFAPGASQAAGAPTPLTISYSQKVGDELPLWIAYEAGYFKKEGLDPKLIFLPSRQGIPALLSGQVQVAAIGGSDGVSAAAEGANLKYVATLSPVYTFQFWANPRHATAATLKGQRVGITTRSGSVYAATVLSLKQLGLSTSDVAMTALGKVSNVDSALLAGSIVAAASHPPATYEFKRHGFVKLVDLAEKKIPAVNTGVAALAPYIEAHGEVIQGVVNAIVEGLKREKTDKAYTESIMKKYMGLTDQAILDFTYDFYANNVAPTVPLTKADQLQAAKDALGAGDPKVKALDVASLIDQRFVEKAAGSTN